MSRLLMALTLLFPSAMVFAGASGNGGYPMPPMAVPIDSPLTLVGLSIVLAIISIRLLRNRG